MSHTDLFPPTIEEMIQEIEQELTMRRRVYPRWVSEKKYTQIKADKKIAVMQAVADLLRDIKRYGR